MADEAATNEPWAVVTLRVTGPGLSAGRTGQLLGRESTAKSGDQWSVDLHDDSGVRLDDQVRVAKDWIGERAEILRGLTDADISLVIGWTPRIPQDGIVVDRELIGLLASVNGYILLDTYLDG